MDDLEDFLQTARSWLNSIEAPVLLTDIDHDFAVLREWQRTLYNAGYMGISWPVEYGGQGLPHEAQLAFNRELAVRGLPPPVGEAGLEVIGPTILTHGSDWQRSTLLPRILSGEDVWCQGFSEPDAGSDLAAIRTTAVLDGDDLVLDGQKTWSSWGTHADWCAVLVRTGEPEDRHRGLTYVLVDMSTPGVSVRPIVQITGDSDFAEIFFDGVRVPASQVLGKINDGWRHAMNSVANERGPYLLKREVEFRVAFGHVLKAMGGLARLADAHSDPDLAVNAQRIGRLAVLLDVLQSHAQRTVQRMEDPEQGAGLMSSVDKLVMTKVEQSLYGETIAMLGGYRNMPGTQPFGLDTRAWLRDYLYGRAASIYGGTDQIQRNIVAERILELPRK